MTIHLKGTHKYQIRKLLLETNTVRFILEHQTTSWFGLVHNDPVEVVKLTLNGPPDMTCPQQLVDILHELCSASNQKLFTRNSRILDQVQYGKIIYCLVKRYPSGSYYKIAAITPKYEIWQGHNGWTDLYTAETEAGAIEQFAIYKKYNPNSIVETC